MTSLALARLVTEVRPVVAQAVDVLHVAALLERRGVTDEVARDGYGHRDVFDLAAAVRERVTRGRSRTAPGCPARPHPGAVDLVARSHADSSDVARGSSSVIRAAPSALLVLAVPALAVLLGEGYVVLALMVGAALGWVWTTLGAYASSTLWRALHHLVFSAPAVAGVLWLAWPDAVRTGTVLTVVAVASGMTVTVGMVGLPRPAPGADRRPPVAPPSRGVWVAGYAVAAATFLLLPQVALLTRQPLTGLALAGLLLALGTVEWRATRLAARLRQLLVSESRPVRFRGRSARLAVGEVVLCAVVCAATSALALAVMARFDVLNRSAVGLAVVAVPLAGVFLLVRVLAETGDYAWLARAFTLGAAVEVAGSLVYGATYIVAFGAATGAVLVALLVGLTTGSLQRFR